MDSSPVNTNSLQKLTPNQFEKKPDKQLEGFDFIRAISSLLVVGLNTNIFILGEIFIASSLATILNANVGYVAVPVFFQISLFLFYCKSERIGFQYFIKKRLPKLVSLYLFWVSIKIVFDVLLKGESQEIKLGTSSIDNFVEVIVSGGHSPYYFFFSLLFITAITEVLICAFRKVSNPLIRTRISYFLLLCTCMLVFLCSKVYLFEGVRELPFLRTISSLGQWDYNPLNFLPYICTTAIVVSEFNEGKLESLTSSLKVKLYSLLALFLIFTILESSLLENLLHYARLSLVFGSWLLLYLALLSNRKPPTSIKFISTCSLGIYVFHPFFTHIIFPLNPNFLLGLSQILPGLDAIAKFAIALTGSIFLTLFFKKIKGLKRFV